MDNKNYLAEKFGKKFAQRKLRVTPQRMAVYEILKTDRNHPSANDVYEKIRVRFPNISFDTVNRTLMLFAETGIVEAVEYPGRERRFDGGDQAHHHFYCIECGRIIDFMDVRYDRLGLPDDISRDHTVISKRMVIKGICNKCKKRQKQGG